jgi:hypothetical protein
MKHLLMLFGFVAMTLAWTGCATTQEGDAEPVSTIPWNRPQGWEGGGALGGFRPPGSY